LAIMSLSIWLYTGRPVSLKRFLNILLHFSFKIVSNGRV
jgi:hypothetical protein